MHIGVPKEIKKQEYRVGLVPSSVRELTSLGHTVYVETHAGHPIGCQDDAYRAAGAVIVPSADEVFAQAEMIVKVKEPQPEEWHRFKEGQILFTYLHLAAEPELADVLCQKKIIGIAYETVTNARGGLPLLAPMSEVAGRLSVQVGAGYLQKHHGGDGVLLGGVAGVSSGRVVVIGGGVVGTAAARVAMGLEAEVTVIDASIDRLRELDQAYGSKIKTRYSTIDTIERSLIEADLVVGAVLVPGAAAPKLVTEKMIRKMKPGSVIVDVSIDQGGTLETSRPTSHEEPIYTEHNVIHYCVTNMPSAVANTSSIALNNATLPYTLQLANLGVRNALAANPHLAMGLNVDQGRIVHAAVKDALHRKAS